MSGEAGVAASGNAEAELGLDGENHEGARGGERACCLTFAIIVLASSL